MSRSLTWDLDKLSALGLACEADKEIRRRVRSDEEKLNFASTPPFPVQGRKE